MKKIAYLVVLMVALFAEGESNKKHTWNIQSDLLSFAFGGYDIAGEYILDDRFSITANAQNINLGYAGIFSMGTQDYGLQGRWYYENPTNQDGAFLGLTLGHRNQSMLVSAYDDAKNMVSYSGSAQGYYATLNWGKKWIWSNGFNISYNLGYGVSSAPTTNLTSSTGAVYSTSSSIGGLLASSGGLRFGWQF